MVQSNQSIVNLLCERVPKLMAIYAFGSRIQGLANAQSDLDLAVLVEGYADPLLLFDIASAVADLTKCEVDLLDFRAATTVMQHQILSTGERWWERDWHAANYETFVFREKYDLDRRRSALMSEIVQRGSVYGR